MGTAKNRKLDELDARRTAGRERAAQATWKGFVDVELTPQEKEAVKALIPKVDDVWSEVLRLVFQGYKLTLSYDGRHNSHNASLTCRSEGDPNNGYTLSGRGGTVWSAVCSLWYKHDVALQGHWDTAKMQQQKLWDDDDVG